MTRRPQIGVTPYGLAYVSDDWHDRDSALHSQAALRTIWADLDTRGLTATIPAPPGEWDPINVVTTLPPDVALVLTLGAAAELMRQLPRRAAQTAMRAAYRADPDSLAALAGSVTGFVFNPLRRGTKRSPVYQDDPR